MTKEEFKQVLHEELPIILNKYFEDNNYQFDKKVAAVVQKVISGNRPKELPGGG